MFLFLAVGCLAPAEARADGCFVLPPFVWNKQKDINEPTQKAIIIHDAGREDLILQVKYEGPVNLFGWLIPVPGLPTVEKATMQCFYELSRYTQELWEPRAGGRHWALNGGPAVGEAAAPEPVKVIEVKTVGAYEVAVLSTRDAGSLQNWLKANQFSFPNEKTQVIDSYVKQQWYFVAVKIRLGSGDSFRFAGPRRGAAPRPELAASRQLAPGRTAPVADQL